MLFLIQCCKKYLIFAKHGLLFKCFRYYCAYENAHLIERGYAQVMTVPPNVKYSDKFLKLQRKARRKNAGLWGKE